METIMEKNLDDSPEANMVFSDMENFEGCSLDVEMEGFEELDVDLSNVPNNNSEDDGNNNVSETLSRVLEMEFESTDDAVRFYEEYSRAKGFSMCHGRKLKNKAGEVIRYTFLCNRQGFREKKYLDMAGRKREHKAVTRCGCTAEMRIKPNGDTGKWFVSRFLDEHNHELIPARFVDQLPSNRKIPDADAVHMDNMMQVGISIPKIYESIAAQSGGFNKVPYMKRDMYNAVRKMRLLGRGDVNATLRYFETCAESDKKMYWRYEVSPEKQLCDLFWCDGASSGRL